MKLTGPLMLLNPLLSPRTSLLKKENSMMRMTETQSPAMTAKSSPTHSEHDPRENGMLFAHSARFEQVLVDEESRKLFLEFLKFHQTEESLLFLNDLEVYQHEYEQMIFHSFCDSTSRDLNQVKSRIRSSSLKATRNSIRLHRLSISSNSSVDSLSSSCSKSSHSTTSSTLFTDSVQSSQSVNTHSSAFLEADTITSIDIQVPPTNFSPITQNKRKSIKRQSKRIFKEVKHLFERLQKLIENYINTGSRYELNIGSHQLVVLELFSKVCESFTDLSHEMNLIECTSSILLQQMDPQLLFGKLVQIVHQDLKSELFPRFVRSELFFNFVQEKGHEYFARHVSHPYSTTTLPLFVDARSDVISEEVLDFGLRMAQEDQTLWKLIHEKEMKNDRVRMSLFTSKRASSMIEMQGSTTRATKRSMKFLKCDLYIPQPFESVVRTWTSFMDRDEEIILRDYIRPMNADLKFQREEDMDILSPGSPILPSTSGCISPLCIQQCHINMDVHIPCVKNRSFPVVATSIGDGQTIAMFAFRSKDCSDQLSSCFMPCLGFFIFYKMGENITRVCHLLSADFSLPFMNSDLLYEAFWKARCSKLARELLSESENNSQQDSLRFLQTMRENAKTFPNMPLPSTIFACSDHK
ncbi:hypothetical protein C9374_000781 [Naegleria lovaniensis]|uniref:RGS domain-containing protein n=1 Tax=Naegleria lovaniensis TaxID=51637 RepID=A0AA88GT68_NAELO|nr:uncharacterized protein C9374_000781 [Naegleria lovaniensis]KAG2387931.1 hypothetical protein C9374_000781 [Naegleria lovaniensis]